MRESHEHTAVLGVMILAVLLRVWLLGVRPMWLDEAYSLNVAAKPVRDIVAFLRVSDVHPVGYYALLSIWIRWFGTGLAAARFPSLVCGLTAVLLTWQIGRRLFSPAIGVVAATLVALNPFQIIASNELRMYPLLEVLVLASTWLLYRAAQSSGLMRWWLAYGVSIALTAYVSYYSLVLIPAQVAWVLLSRPSRRSVVNLAAAGGVALVLYLPWIPYVLGVPGRGIAARLPTGLGDLISVLATQTYGGYLFGNANYQTLGSTVPFPFDLGLVLPWCGLLMLGAGALGRINRAGRQLVGLSWMGPLVLLLAASLVLGKAAAYPRHLVFLEPFAALLLAAGIVQLRAWTATRPQAWTVLLWICCASAFAYPAVAQANPAYRYYHYDLAAAYVRARYAAADVVVYFPAGTDLPFRYYFNPTGEQIVVLPDRRQWSRDALRPAVLKTARFVAAHGFEHIWLVFSGPWPKGSLSDLVEALGERGYRWSPEQNFSLLWVMELNNSNRSAAGPRNDASPANHDHAIQIVGP
ncbi:MAG TPA: glycosyltransferase family 39 protein [bacterium]|nr:glycosyltransferase family 39 protein [bacterium]